MVATGSEHGSHVQSSVVWVGGFSTGEGKEPGPSSEMKSLLRPVPKTASVAGYQRDTGFSAVCAGAPTRPAVGGG